MTGASGRTKVDRRLAALARAMEHVEGAADEVRTLGFRTRTDVRRHLARLRNDLRYAAACSQLVLAAREHDGDVAAFIDQHRPLLDDAGVDLRIVISVERLVQPLVAAPPAAAHWHEARAALVRETGAATYDEAEAIATDARPLLDVDHLLEGTPPAPPGLKPTRLAPAIRVVDEGLVVLGRAAVEARAGVADLPDAVLDQLAALELTPGPRWAASRFMRAGIDEADVRAVLADLGYPAAVTTAELAAQIRSVASVHPDVRRSALADVHLAAHTLMTVSGEPDAADAYRAIRQRLGAKAPKPPRGSVVKPYSARRRPA
jgi:hypothetical protein